MPKWTKEQEEAINQKGKNIIVSAGAGSGKTAVLTERVYTHLKKGIKINELLIITFTNAAAAEMKNRIRKKIKEDESIKENLDLIDNAPITTFDAYSLKIVKDYSTFLGISDKISIVDNTFIEIKKEEVLNKIFEKHYKEKDPLFIELIDNYTLKDDKEIIENILEIYGKIISKYDKREFLKEYVKINYNKDTIKKHINEYEEYLIEKIMEIKDLSKELEFQIEGNYFEKLNSTLNSLFVAKTYEEINAEITLPRLPSGSTEEAKEIKKQITEKIKELKLLTRYKNKEEIEEILKSTENSAKIIIELIKELDEELDKYKKEKNVYEFADISNMAIQILINNREAREKLKKQYYEILVDEYQDTNDTQEKFISLIEKDNVYMVGDIKQSIYRFRNTNPKLFKRKYNEYSKNEKGLKIDLNKNFRSREEVLTGINKIFDQIMDESIGGANYKATHRMIFGNNAYSENNKENYSLEILNYQDEPDYSKEEIEIFTIAKDIKDKIEKGYEIIDRDTWKARKIRYEDFAILIDRSSSFNKYKKIFEYLNIPLNLYKEQTITESKDLLVITSIYNLIINIYKKEYTNEFKYSYVSIERSYLYETEDSKILDNLNSIKETEIYQKCSEIAQNIGTKTNYQIIEEIIEKFNIYQKIIRDGNIDEHIIVLDSIKEISKNMDDLGITPEEFKEYLKYIIKKGLDIKVKTNKINDKSVKIMTIHASKGLEFPICYYSGLFRKFNLDELKNKFYYSKNYGLIVPYYDNSPKTTILKNLLKKDYTKEEISERLRLFYVALTRAREKMIIVTSIDEENQKQINESTKLKYTSFKSVIDSISPSLNNHIKNVDNKKINLTKEYKYKNKKVIKMENSKHETLTVNEVNIKEEEIKNSKYSKQIKKMLTKEEYQNIETGKRMHKIFENFDFIKPDYTNLNEYEASKIKAFIETNILKDTKEIYKEYEFVTEESHGIIDLLLIKDKKNIIIDYKLRSLDDKEYVNQLKGYQDYIESLTGKQTETYLYSILDETLKKV
ncbi:MAG: UvrD-helicase domain-containing protein [Bacilli bacterium]|nr:UvrD-helicase domain-containing protein [Bacilli bacterium]